mgnify:CR=1 FL=1
MQKALYKTSDYNDIGVGIYFKKILGLNFNVRRMVESYNKITKKHEFDDGGGKVSFLSSIGLNKDPNKKNSTKGKFAWGRYWTKPRKDGIEEARADYIDEEEFTEFVSEFKDTYFKAIYDILSSRYLLGRVRILKKSPRSTLSWHRDPEPRLHIPIITNPGCRMVIEDKAIHMPADGSVWITDATKYHNAFNGGEEDRIHLVATLPKYKF